MPLLNNDTICAIATAPGGAIGIVRLSGTEAFRIIHAVCPSINDTSPARTALLSDVFDPSTSVVVDEALVTLFPAPHSYTGENSVEISCHGSRYILYKVLDVLVRQGARTAGPGEFTQRAFLNGKLDLSQAEAVADLIASSSQAAHQMAMNQLRGHYSSQLGQLRQDLLRLTSLLELELDFADHEELEFADRTELLELASSIDSHITRMAKSFETGQAIKQGFPVAIVGKTNVGKSTLLNRLLKDDRAIVSEVHGTTRDTIEDTMEIHGITFRFIDTAGIRETSDAVEIIGIERTYAAIDKARIVLWLIDMIPSEEETADMLTRTQGRTLIPVWNKSDLNPACIGTISGLPVVSISAKQGIGIEALESAIFSATGLSSLSDSDVIISNARHYDALVHAHESLVRVVDGLRTHLPTDLVAEDLHLTLDFLAEITGGSITPQETLNNIFKHFCVGK